MLLLVKLFLVGSNDKPFNYNYRIWWKTKYVSCGNTSYIDETVSYEGYPQNAEKVNGRWAMIGFIALIGAYITTGQVIPGIF